MSSSLFQTLLFLFLFYRSLNCSILSKRELKRPETVVGEVYSYIGSDKGEAYEVDKTLHQVPLRDLRSMKVPNLRTWGFTYVSGRRVKGIKDLEEFSFKNKAALDADCVELVKDLTGARMAYALGGGYRDHASSESVRAVQKIHSDMTPTGATWFKNKAKDLLLGSRDPSEVEFGNYLLRGKKVVIYNVWRPLTTVQDNHLGLCRWDSRLKEDALTSIPVVTKARNALQPWRYNERQDWYYLSQQEPHEVYVFKQHDAYASDGHGINVPHASFNIKGQKIPDTRKSYETRVIVILEPSIKRKLLEIKDHIKSTITKFKWNSPRDLEKKKA